MAKKTVVIGFLGLTLDSPAREDRWDRWRPTISLCQQEDLLIDRFELLDQKRSRKLGKRVSQDMRQVSPR